MYCMLCSASKVNKIAQDLILEGCILLLFVAFFVAEVIKTGQNRPLGNLHKSAFDDLPTKEQHSILMVHVFGVRRCQNKQQGIEKRECNTRKCEKLYGQLRSEVINGGYSPLPIVQNSQINA